MDVIDLLRSIDLEGESSESSPCASRKLERAQLVEIEAGGVLKVRTSSNVVWRCEWLESSVALKVGDNVLALGPGKIGDKGVVVGRVRLYAAPDVDRLVQATESLTLQCGEASINLRADGKVMVRGEDVLLRSKGTQRIRAGNVAIN